jgi:CDP-6-deoxy-D-xylo-4-hexulose-3-dehydrase
LKKIPYAGRVFDKEEISNLIQSANEFQLTNGHFIKEFEEGISEYLGVKHSLMVNSGSSANLLAFMTLTSHELGEKRITRNSEIITIACAFPTTISPIINYGAVPVFVDVDIETVNIKVEDLEKALSLRTKAVFIAHTLGNPFDIKIIQNFCIKNDLWLISDCCDSLGSTYKGKSLEYYGHISTSSFYPAHHITTGQGGAIHTDNDTLYRIAKSFCNWGRDYKCNVCKLDCKRRYDFNDGYDCRYTYSELGYNLQPTEMQAAIGVAQLKKLPEFIEQRQNNKAYLKLSLFLGNSDVKKYLQSQFNNNENADWSPFAFLLTLKENTGFTRNEIVKYLEDNGIETRFMFAGNILRQECFKHLQENIDYRVIGNLENTNYIMDNSFFIGCYPGLKEEDLDYMVETIKNFITQKETNYAAR